MKNKKGFTLVELIGVIAILAVIALISSVVYLNVKDSLLNKQYKNVVDYIESAAEEYARNTSIIVTNVKTLIEEGYISADDESGAIYDPRNNDINLSCNVVNTVYEDGDYTSTMSTDTACELTEEQTDVAIIENGNTSCGDLQEWYSAGITLGVAIRSNCGTQLTSDKYEFSWTSTTGAYSDSETYTVEKVDNQIINATFTVNIKAKETEEVSETNSETGTTTKKNSNFSRVNFCKCKNRWYISSVK